MELAATIVTSNVVGYLMRSKWILQTLYDSTVAVGAAWSFVRASKSWTQQKHVHLQCTNNNPSDQTAPTCWCQNGQLDYKLKKVRALFRMFEAYKNKYDNVVSEELMLTLDYLYNAMHLLEQRMERLQKRIADYDRARVYHWTYWRGVDLSDDMNALDALVANVNFFIQEFTDAWERSKVIMEGTTASLKPLDNAKIVEGASQMYPSFKTL